MPKTQSYMSLLPIIKLDHLSNLYVEKVTISLVREYLYKKNFKATLKIFHGEENAFPGISDSRAPLAKELQLESLLRENKLKAHNDNGHNDLKKRTRTRPLDSMLEVLVKDFIHTTKAQAQHCNGKANDTIPNLKSVRTQTSQSFNFRIGTDKAVQTDRNQNQDPKGFEKISDIKSQTSSQDSYSTSDFFDPEQVQSPPLIQSLSPEEMSRPNSGSKSSRGGPRSFTRSNSQNKSLKDEQDEEEERISQMHEHEDPSSSPPKSFDNEFQIKRHNPKIAAITNSFSNASSDSEASKISLAESVLQSKQNILVEGCLTPAEIHKRKGQQRSLSEDSQHSQTGQNHKEGMVAPGFGVHSDILELCDIEDDDELHSDNGNSISNSAGRNFIHIRNIPRKNHNVFSQLDMETWKKLKIAIMGTSGFLQNGWVGQGFVFNPEITYGLVQKMGGPCGVLAVVQALLLRNMMFGSKYCSSSLPLDAHEISSIFERSDSGSSSGLDQLSPKISYSLLTSKRSEALRAAIVEILWECSPTSESEIERKIRICLQGNEPGARLVDIHKLEDLQSFVDENLDRFDCIGLVYSTVLSRGIDRIVEDMDFDSPLIGQHGYCSQELVNLLLHGKCISNVFDNEVNLDEKILHGIKAQSDIGFLSLFEHYGSCEVGKFMKNPKFPIWIVCSESHFSVLFSPSLEIISKENPLQTVFQNGFDLFYYDGLAKQQQSIRLTISFDSQSQYGRKQGASSFLTLPEFGNNLSTQNETKDDNDHLIPPLEKCIRTKWKNARVFWNGTEPIL